MIQEGNRSRIESHSPSAPLVSSQRRQAFERNRHRVYAIAFWMTGSELAAEDLMADVFRAALSRHAAASAQEVDRALVDELREVFDIPVLTLHCVPNSEVREVRRNMLRTELESAVFQLPATEKLIFLLHDVEGYDHDSIARLIGVTERESQLGLYQARLRLRDLLSQQS
jgi:RNA polymerase sigma-70 factor (ECF subfamily)